MPDCEWCAHTHTQFLIWIHKCAQIIYTTVKRLIQLNHSNTISVSFNLYYQAPELIGTFKNQRVQSQFWVSTVFHHVKCFPRSPSCIGSEVKIRTQAPDMEHNEMPFLLHALRFKHILRVSNYCIYYHYWSSESPTVSGSLHKLAPESFRHHPGS